MVYSCDWCSKPLKHSGLCHTCTTMEKFGDECEE